MYLYTFWKTIDLTPNEYILKYLRSFIHGVVYSLKDKKNKNNYLGYYVFFIVTCTAVCSHKKPKRVCV